MERPTVSNGAPGQPGVAYGRVPRASSCLGQTHITCCVSPPWWDSNPHLQLRRLTLSPLSYKGWCRFTWASSPSYVSNFWLHQGHTNIRVFFPVRHVRRRSGIRTHGSKDHRLSKPGQSASLPSFQRRNWDSNPGTQRSHAFEAWAIVHSAIPPCPGHSVHPVSWRPPGVYPRHPVRVRTHALPGHPLPVPWIVKGHLPPVSPGGTRTPYHLRVLLRGTRRPCGAEGWVLLPVGLCSTT